MCLEYENREVLFPGQNPDWEKQITLFHTVIHQNVTFQKFSTKKIPYRVYCKIACPSIQPEARLIVGKRFMHSNEHIINTGLDFFLCHFTQSSEDILVAHWTT